MSTPRNIRSAEFTRDGRRIWNILGSRRHLEVNNLIELIQVSQSFSPLPFFWHSCNVSRYYKRNLHAKLTDRGVSANHCLIVINMGYETIPLRSWIRGWILSLHTISYLVLFSKYDHQESLNNLYISLQLVPLPP